MSAGMKALLHENPTSLKLSTMVSELQRHLRQARQDKLDYDESLLHMMEVEVQVHKENGSRRRLREARFTLLKPLDTFRFDAAPDLDARLITELSSCEYTKQGRNILFMGKRGPAKLIWQPHWVWKPASSEYLHDLLSVAVLPASLLKSGM